MPIIIASPGNGTILVSDFLSRLDNLMNDDDRVRWGQEERIEWLNDAAHEIVLRRPGARAVTMLMDLVGGTLQIAPDGTAQVLDVVRNRTASGAYGRAITLADRHAIDRADPDWHSARAGVTRHYMVDDRSPTSFYVYPPAVAGAQVELLLSVPPPVVSAPEDQLDMRPEFINALINWALYRCHTKDSEYANGAVAAQHYQAFTDAIGAPTTAATQNSPQGNSV